MIFASITRFNGFLRNVSTVFKTNEKRYRRFRSKELPKRHLLFRNLLLIRLISNWTSCRTIHNGNRTEWSPIRICNRMGQLRINFTRIFKVFTKLPESRSDEGNLENFENTSEINP